MALQRDTLVDALKGLAILLVVYGHLLQRHLVLNGVDFFSHPVFQVVYTFHMPFFVLISGWLMSRSLAGKSFAYVLNDRWQGLMIPFLCWGLLGVLALTLVSVLDGQSSSWPWFLGLVFKDMVQEPAVWFLSTLFLSSLLLVVSLGLEKKFGIGSFLLVYLLLLFFPWPHWGGIYYVQWFYLFFLAGYALGRARVLSTGLVLRPPVFVLLLAVFMVLFLAWDRNDFIYVNQMTWHAQTWLIDAGRLLYRYLMGFLGIVLFFTAGSFLLRGLLGSFLAGIGAFSLDIYLVQRFLVEGFYPRLVGVIPFNIDISSPVFLIGVMPLLTVFFSCVCILISQYLLRRHNWSRRLLLGGRGGALDADKQKHR